MGITLQINAFTENSGNPDLFTEDLLKHHKPAKLKKMCRSLQISDVVFTVSAGLQDLDAPDLNNPDSGAGVVFEREGLSDAAQDIATLISDLPPPQAGIHHWFFGGLHLCVGELAHDILKGLDQMTEDELMQLVRSEERKQSPNLGVMRELEVRVLAKRIVGSKHVTNLDKNLVEIVADAKALIRHLCSVAELEAAIHVVREASQASLDEKIEQTRLEYLLSAFGLVLAANPTSTGTKDQETEWAPAAEAVTQNPLASAASADPAATTAFKDSPRDGKWACPEPTEDMLEVETGRNFQPVEPQQTHDAETTEDLLQIELDTRQRVEDMLLKMFRETRCEATIRVNKHGWIEVSSLTTGEQSSVELVIERSDPAAVALFGAGVVYPGEDSRANPKHSVVGWKRTKGLQCPQRIREPPTLPARSGKYVGNDFAGHDFSSQPSSTEASLVFQIDGREHSVHLSTKITTVHDAVKELHKQPWVARAPEDENLAESRRMAEAIVSRLRFLDPLKGQDCEYDCKFFGPLRYSSLPTALQTNPKIRRDRRFEAVLDTMMAAMFQLLDHQTDQRGSEKLLVVGQGVEAMVDLASGTGESMSAKEFEEAVDAMLV
eukprot:COSAG05_NODE_617_length_8321_cov_5.107382_3_plen_606_part_00